MGWRNHRPRGTSVPAGFASRPYAGTAPSVPVPPTHLARCRRTRERSTARHRPLSDGGARRPPRLSGFHTPPPPRLDADARVAVKGVVCQRRLRPARPGAAGGPPAGAPPLRFHGVGPAGRTDRRGGRRAWRHHRLLHGRRVGGIWKTTDGARTFATSRPARAGDRRVGGGPSNRIAWAAPARPSHPRQRRDATVGKFMDGATWTYAD